MENTSLTKKIFHIVPHSHWDREWYMPFEWHRYRLIQLIDDIIEVMEKDPEYRCFHLDGQMIVLEDYLAIKPYMRERLFRLIHDGRIQVGPWYVLQDEYLISEEANVRNMLIGLEMCRELGVEPVMTGYFPDSFGNISQIPQILNGFDIRTAVFGRGGNNNSEINWCSEDGSRVAAVWFAGWYHNALEMPVDEEASRARVEKLLRSADTFSLINDHLGMNGSDHEPVQKNLTEALRVANRVCGSDIQFIHSSLKDFLKILEEHRAEYPDVTGELAGQDGPGLNLLIGTASSRIYLKQWNHRVQTALERRAEPLDALASLSGKTVDRDFLRFAWKKLLENHAHDSICGCSIDEVHRQMISRFESAGQVADKVADEAIKHLSAQMDVSGVPGHPFTVWNTSVYPKSGLIEAAVDFDEQEGMGEYHLLDHNGNEVPCTIVWEPHVFTYTLPDNAFRVVKYVNRCHVRFAAEQVPAMGNALYTLVPGPAKQAALLTCTENSAENAWLRLTIDPDGALCVTDKVSGAQVNRVNVYEDVMDIGDEYMFASAGDTPITTAGSPAKVTLESVSPFEAVFVIDQSLTVPAGYDRKKGCALAENKTLAIRTRVSVSGVSRAVEIRTEIDNCAENHRLRALFPNTVKTDKVYAHGHFDIVERNIQTGPRWKNPTNEQRMQAFVELRDEKQALVVAGHGLHEYEVSRDGSNTLSLTILRAVDILGDWGDFPTPEAQCQGTCVAEYAIQVGAAAEHCRMEQEALEYYAGPMPVVQVQAGQTGTIRPNSGLVTLEGSGVWCTAFKCEERGGDLVLRLYNTQSTATEATLHTDSRVKGVMAANLAEKREGEELLKNGSATLTFRPKEIRTLILSVSE